MTLATLASVMELGRRDGFIVAGLGARAWEDASVYVEAAEETGLPIVLQAGPGARRHTAIAVLGRMFRRLAESATVPIACHVDQAYSLAECRQGFDSGFTSVMIDGSKLPFEENIALTRAVVELARLAKASVEGEIGIPGYIEGAASPTTAPEQARIFERETGVNLIAITVGHAHLDPECGVMLDFKALEAIEAVTLGPLALHGGGLSLADRGRLARGHRVGKVTFPVEVSTGFGHAPHATHKARPDSFDRIEAASAKFLDVRVAARAALLSLKAAGRQQP